MGKHWKNTYLQLVLPSYKSLGHYPHTLPFTHTNSSVCMVTKGDNTYVLGSHGVSIFPTLKMSIIVS